MIHYCVIGLRPHYTCIPLCQNKLPDKDIATISMDLVSCPDCLNKYHGTCPNCENQGHCANTEGCLELEKI
jgi:hypothetical protein